MTDDITNDLALLDDWLAGKGYGEEAGLCLRAMDLIRKQAAEIQKLRAANMILQDKYLRLQHKLGRIGQVLEEPCAAKTALGESDE